MNALEAFALVSRARFEPFTKGDWDAFCGCQSAKPQIAQVDELTLILDGAYLSVVDAEGDEFIFRLDEV
jgi:hypothetical protein